MSVGSIVVDLLARTGSFETDTKRAAKLAQQRAKEIDEAFTKAGKAIGVALAAGATAAAYAFKSTVDRMDDLSKAAQRASMPTEDFSRLAYAADLADVSMQDLQGSMGKLAKAQGDAARGSAEQVRAFEALGIAYKNADGSLRDTNAVFLEFADRFQEFQGSPEIVTLGMQLFGRSFQTLIPLLKDGAEGLREAGAEADALGVTLSTKAGQQAEAFNDNVTRLTKSVEGLRIELFSGLIPQLDGVIERFIAATREGLGFVDAIDIALNVSGFQPLDEKIQITRDKIKQLQGYIDAGVGPGGGFVNVEGLQREIDGYQAQLDRLIRVERRMMGRDPNTGSLGALVSEPPIEKPRRRPRITPTTGSSSKRDMTPIDMTDEQRTLLAAIGLYEDIEKRAKDYGLTLEWLDTLYFNGAIGVEQYDAAVRQLTGSTATFGKDGVAALEDFHAKILATKEPISELDEFTLEAARNIQDALGDETYNILRGDFDNIGDRWADLLARMAADALAANLSRSLFGDFASTGAIGGLLGAGLDWLTGAGGVSGGGGAGLGSAISAGMTSADDWMLAGLAGRRADGGPVSAGSTYLVGERGPELFTPGTSGAVVPNHALGGGGVSITNHYRFESGVNVAQLTQAAEQIRRQTVADVFDKMRRANHSGDYALMGG